VPEEQMRSPPDKEEAMLDELDIQKVTFSEIHRRRSVYAPLRFPEKKARRRAELQRLHD
jgi:hypothetical protein